MWQCDHSFLFVKCHDYMIQGPLDINYENQNAEMLGDYKKQKQAARVAEF